MKRLPVILYLALVGCDHDKGFSHGPCHKVPDSGDSLIAGLFLIVLVALFAWEFRRAHK